MALTDAACKSVKPKEKPFKLSDSGGLYLEVMPNGSKYWRFKYRYMKKENRLALGTYPLIGLKEAREKRDVAKRLLLDGTDPSEAKKSEKRQKIDENSNTFKVVALEWYELNKERWSKSYLDNITRIMKNDLFPTIGNRPMTKIKAPDLLSTLKKIEKRGAIETTTRARKISGQIFRYGIQVSKCEYNPVPDLYGAFKRRQVKHMASIEISEIPELLDALENNDARLFYRTRRAIRLSLLTFVRPGELRQAIRSEFNFDKQEWVIPASRMKMRKDHIVPLSTQAIKYFKEQFAEVEHAKSGLLFPNQKKPSFPMSDNTVRLALHRLGYANKMTPHGFRALARTAIREELDYEGDVIEVQLAHKPIGSLGNAYDRTKFIKKRHQMMQDWADYLDRVHLEYKKKKIEEKLASFSVAD